MRAACLALLALALDLVSTGPVAEPTCASVVAKATHWLSDCSVITRADATEVGENW